MPLHSEITQYMNNKDRFVVCCFFTENYLSHAESLKKSLEAFDISYCFKRVEDAGYWEANTRIKPHFIQECLQQFPDKAILYLDADAVVKKPLDYFNHIETDVAFYKTKGMEGMSHDYLASTLFFNNNDNTKVLVQHWIDAQVKGKKTQVDQDSLDIAMEQLIDTLSIEPLPAGYIKIFDKDYDGEIYIEQYQASRSLTKLRRKRIRQRNLALIVSVLAILLFVFFK